MTMRLKPVRCTDRSTSAARAERAFGGPSCPTARRPRSSIPCGRSSSDVPTERNRSPPRHDARSTVLDEEGLVFGEPTEERAEVRRRVVPVVVVLGPQIAKEITGSDLLPQVRTLRRGKDA